MTDPIAPVPREEPVDPDDVLLVASVQGELEARAEWALRARLEREPALRQRRARLLAADQDLLNALDAGPAARPRARAGWWRVGVSLAALLIVALTLWSETAAPGTVRNELVELAVAPRGGASQPLFTDVAFELRWRLLRPDDTTKGLAVHAWPFGTSTESIGVGVAAAEIGGKLLPLVVSANVRGPDGVQFEARLGTAFGTDPGGPGMQQAVFMLRDFEVPALGPAPYLGGRPDVRAWSEDFAWAYRHMPSDGPRRCLPDRPGEWRLELRVDTVPPPRPGLWPVFAAPLVVETAVVLTAEVSAWGEEHDGLRARMLWSTGCADVDRTPMALQIENRSGRPRAYNVTGTTLARIPQPLHFSLVTGDEGESVWQQRERLGVITAADDLMREHPDGTVRTLLVCPDYFRLAGKALSELHGPQQLRMEFHFEPTAWVGGDRGLWMGKLLTGAIGIAVP